MTHDDDQLRRMFAGLRFPDEPAKTPRIAEDVRRAERYLRRRRAAAWGATTASVALLASGVAFALPNLGASDVDDHVSLPSEVEEGGDAEADSATVTEPDDSSARCPVSPGDDDPLLQFSDTRQCLLEVAVKHFDQDWKHLPKVSTNQGGGGNEEGQFVATKLDWQVPGETGLGMVHVAVTTPGYADGEYAKIDMAGFIGCDELADCADEAVPGTGENVLIAGANPEQNLLFGVMYERPDGSFTAVAVYDLFGNNSLEPVSDVDITLEQAMAFVTDPALRVDQTEIAEAAAAAEPTHLGEIAPEEADFSNTEVVPAPDTREMTAAGMRSALNECIEGADEWSDFEPALGLSIESDSESPLFMVIAERGATQMMCDYSSAMLFGTSDVKGTAFLRGAVSGETPYFGRYTSDVDRITVQFSGEPQREAVMKGGYWYLPYEAAISGTNVVLSPSALRGYDASGELVYDSTTADPEACYADPSGSEIVYYGSDEDPDVKDCVPMLEWDF